MELRKIVLSLVVVVMNWVKKGERKCLFGRECDENNKPKCTESEKECLNPGSYGESQKFLYIVSFLKIF